MSHNKNSVQVFGDDRGVPRTSRHPLAPGPPTLVDRIARTALKSFIHHNFWWMDWVIEKGAQLRDEVNERAEERARRVRVY